jgi:tellurite resistance protein|tara:strand:- start:110 stop:499 length:390 start_codon:yes stop_codon:yes gene_type:complete
MFLYDLNRNQKEAFICLAHVVAVSDGELSPGEQQMMGELKREIGLSSAFEPHYMPIDGIGDIFNTRSSRVATIIALIRLGYADGEFEIEEQFLLKEICATFEVTEPDFTIIENWVRRLVALEREARAFM